MRMVLLLFESAQPAMLRGASRTKQFRFIFLVLSMVFCRLEPEQMLSLCWITALKGTGNSVYLEPSPLRGSLRVSNAQHRTSAKPPTWGNLMKTNRLAGSKRHPVVDASNSAAVERFCKLGPLTVTSVGSAPDT